MRLLDYSANTRYCDNLINPIFYILTIPLPQNTINILHDAVHIYKTVGGIPISKSSDNIILGAKELLNVP